MVRRIIACSGRPAARTCFGTPGCAERGRLARCSNANVWDIYGIDKTTVYLPRELKVALRRLARRLNRSEAELLREAVARLTHVAEAPAPRLPLFRSRGPSIAGRIDEELAKGFG